MNTLTYPQETARRFIMRKLAESGPAHAARRVAPFYNPNSLRNRTRRRMSVRRSYSWSNAWLKDELRYSALNPESYIIRHPHHIDELLGRSHG